MNSSPKVHESGRQGPIGFCIISWKSRTRDSLPNPFGRCSVNPLLRAAGGSVPPPSRALLDWMHFKTLLIDGPAMEHLDEPNIAISQDRSRSATRKKSAIRADQSGSHRSTHIASDLASRALALQAKRQRESESQALASLDLNKHPDFGPTSQVFRRLLFWHFPAISDQANVFSHRWRKKTFFASLATWGCAIRIASHIANASRDLGRQGADQTWFVTLLSSPAVILRTGSEAPML